MVLDIWRPRSGMTPWRPLKDFEDMERYFENFFANPWSAQWARLPASSTLTPLIDVFEQDGNFVLKAELPGMKEGDIDISVEGNMLNIKGEKKAESEIKEENYYQCERSYGSFFRSVPIPSSVDADKIQAEYENGVLQVTMPKMAEAQPKKVSVSAKEKSTKS